MSKKFILGVSVFSILTIVFSYLIFSSGSKPIKESTTVEVKETFFDFGKIKVSEQKEKIFVIKNIGKKPLQLFNISTSCGCTAVQIIYQGKTSREISMHSQSDYTAEIAPQTTAKLKIIYRPYSMPVYGTVVREVYLSTNDPQKQKLVLSIKANVQ